MPEWTRRLESLSQPTDDEIEYMTEALNLYTRGIIMWGGDEAAKAIDASIRGKLGLTSFDDYIRRNLHRQAGE